ALGGANKDALVRVEGNFQTILATSPKSAKALKVPWVKSLGNFGVTASTASDGLSIDFSAQTSGVTADQLPLAAGTTPAAVVKRSEEHTSELQSRSDLVCRLLLEKKKKTYSNTSQ